jgi:hypothetical protein
MASGRLNTIHPIMQFDVMRSRKPRGSNAKQILTSTNLWVEFMLQVIQGYGYNFILDHWSTICTNFVSMIWGIVSMG